MSRPVNQISREDINRAWLEYLQAFGVRRGDSSSRPPDMFVRAYRAGWLSARGWKSEERYSCDRCDRESFPNYGRCAFCGHAEGDG